MSRVVVRGLTRTYGARAVVENVDLDVAAGEVFGLIGPNGGGKSTLLLLLAGLVTPTSGTVTIDGVPSATLAATGAGTVGLITAEPGLYPLLTGRENLHYFGGLHGRTPAQVDERAGPILASLEVSSEIDRPSGAYSSGMRQKISLVRALLLEPAVLLLDEPTSNLDPVSAMTILSAVRSQADAGVAVVLATHDLHAAEHLCDRVGLIAGTLRATRELSGDRGVPPLSILYALFRVGLS